MVRSMRCGAAILGIGLWLAVTLPAQHTAPVAVDAIVTDGDGRPLAGAEFADSWSCVAGSWVGTRSCSPPEEKAPLRSDADGRLRGTWILDPFERPLLGRSADGNLVAVVRPEVTADHALVVRHPIVLQPAVLLRVVVRAPAAVSLWLRELARASPWCPFASHYASDAPQVRLPLPPGSYEVVAAAGHSRSSARTIVLPAGRGEVDAGAFTILWRPFDLLGEVLPDWELASVDNLAPERATLAALRGRPLLIVFDEWGRRWQPRGDLRQGVAALASHPRRSAFHVVLFDTSTRPPGFDQPPNEPVVERTLPLLRPLPGKNADTLYGSNWAIVVLDADGRLVHCGRGLAEAVAALERLLPPIPVSPAEERR